MRMFVTFILLFVCLSFASCNQKGLDEWAKSNPYFVRLNVSYDPRWHLVYDAGVDWAQNWDAEEYMMTYQSLIPDLPSGLRVIVYHNDGSNNIYNLSTYGGVFDVNTGTHSLIMFNNDTEYIVFNDINMAASVNATTRARSRASYVGSAYVRSEANENTINPPDMLYACDGGQFNSPMPGDTLDLIHELRPLVYKYLVRYHFESGIQYAVLARGGLAGMAASVFLNDGHTSNALATILYDIDMANKRVTDSEKGEGMLYTVVNSFGVPGFPNDYYSRNDNTYGLNLELRLTNGDTQTIDFDITDQIKAQPRGGVINVYGVNIEEPPNNNENNAFGVKVDVEGWGPNQDVIIM